MEKEAVYGIDYIKLANAIVSGENAGAYPDFDTVADKFMVRAIVKDSMQYNDSAPGTNDIEVEDMDDYFASLPSEPGKKGFTLQTYDMGAGAYKYLLGYTKNGEWNEEAVGYKLPNLAVELKTKEIDGFPAFVFQWAKMKVTVTRSGTIGKSGFPNFNLEFQQLANLDKNGKEISGARNKIYTAPAVDPEVPVG